MKRQHLTWIKRSTAALGALTIAVWGTLFALTGAPSASADAASTSSQLLNLSDHATALPSGPVIVEAMAPWCEYCATTAKWLDVSDARWAHAHHLPFVLVDVSALGGVGKAAQAPTLASIATTAYDGSRTPLSTNAAIASNMRRFQATYHLTMPVEFWSHGQVPASWDITSIPTFLYLNAQHRVVGTLSGYHTAAQFRAWASQIAKDKTQ